MRMTKMVFTSQLLTLVMGTIFMLSTSQTVAQQINSKPVQENFSEAELKSFVEANERVTKIQQETQQKMVQAIEDEGLTVDRFNEILQAQQDTEKKTDASSEELVSFNSAAQVIMIENKKTETKMETAIQEQGLDLDTYHEIIVAYQQSPKVKSKIDDLLKDQQ